MGLTSAARALLPWRTTYLLDFAVYQPPEELRVDLNDIEKAWVQGQKGAKVFSGGGAGVDEHEAMALIEFQAKVFTKAGLGAKNTYLPKSIHPKYCEANPRTDLDSAYDECHMAVCGAVEALLDKTGLRPRDIDVLVTTCSIYCPTPSMAAMVINTFGMRNDVVSYHLGGMGCANGVVAVNLVADLLKAHPGCRALFVTNETTTPAFYRGKDRHRLVTNVLFRMGAAAMLMSNRASDAGRAKYKVHARTRVTTAAREDAYKCIWYGPDAQGLPGIYLGMNVVTEASRALTFAMTRISPYILTWSEIGRYLAWAVQTSMGKNKDKAKDQPAKDGPQQPAAPAAAAATKPTVPATTASPAAARSEGPKPSPAPPAALAPAGPEGVDRELFAGERPDGSAGQAAEPAGPSTAADAAGTAKLAAAPSASGTSGTAAAMPARKLTPVERIAQLSDEIRASERAGPQPSRRPLVPPPEAGSFVPKFSECIQHFLIHAGGAKVLDGIGSSLRLDEYALAPSRAVLRDFGNVSSSTTWYTLAYIEATRGVLQGDRVLQVGVGSGIKCGVNVWQALRDIHDVHPAWQHRVDAGETPAAAREQRPRPRRNAWSGPDMEHAWLLVLALVALLLALFMAGRL